jgi:histidine phosphotransferase ChpT
MNEVLAAGLAARLVHDISGPVSGVTSGLDLHAASESEAIRREGLDIAEASARSLLELLAFFRVAYGQTGEARTAESLEGLARTQFTGTRARLIWSPTAAVFSAEAAQALLLLAQIAAGGLAIGGVARLEAEARGRAMLIRIAGDGATAGLHPETAEGLSGRARSNGLAGRWAPAFYLHALAARVGGGVTLSEREPGFSLEAVMPIQGHV